MRLKTFEIATENRAVFPGSGVYPLLDRDSCLQRDLDPIEVLTAWGAGGNVTYYQWRAKGLPVPEYIAQARAFRRAVPELKIFANDCVSAVLNTHAPDGSDSSVSHPPGESLFAGLHLGQEDLQGLPPQHFQQLGRLRAENLEFVLGLSTHNAEQIRSALIVPEPGPLWSYLALGPCFPTRSKPTGHDPVLTVAEFELALETLAGVLGQSEIKKPFPLVLIGGINSTNIEELLRGFAEVRDANLIRLVVAGIGSTLDGSEISSLAEKIQNYSS